MLPEFLERAVAGKPERDAHAGAHGGGRRRLPARPFPPPLRRRRHADRGRLRRAVRPARGASLPGRLDAARDDVGDTEPRGGLRRHVPGRGEPRLRMGLPLLRRRLHVPARALPQPRARCAPASRAASRSGATIGLVGAEMASQPGVAALCQEIAAAGGRASPSSLKADLITPALARALGAGGNRSVTVAPEAGSERMRRVINKNLTEAEILRAAEWLVGGGVDALKLYVMVGLPTETDADVDGIADLVHKVRARLMGDGRPKVGRILVSINPFVPKPWTPFQWEPMEDLALAQAQARRRAARARRRSRRCRSRPRVRARRTCRRCSRAATGASPTCWSACTPIPGDWWSTLARAAAAAARRASTRTASSIAATLPTSCCRGTSSITRGQALPPRRAPQGHRGACRRRRATRHLPQLRRVLTGRAVIVGHRRRCLRDRSHAPRARRAARRRASAPASSRPASRRTARRGAGRAPRATPRASPPRRRR